MKSKYNLLVAGVHKAGTTSIYQYLGDHPLIFKPLKKEIHFFTPLIYTETKLDNKNYLRYFSEVQEEQYLLDVSPSYLYGGQKIIDEISKLNNPKTIVILRDPTDRFISFYKQGIKSGKIPKHESLGIFFKKSLEEFKSFTEINTVSDTFINRSLREGCYSIYLEDWITTFKQNFKIIFFEDLVKNPIQILTDICKWLDIENTYSDYSFIAENKSYTPKSQLFSKTANSFYLKYESFFRKNERLLTFFKTIYYSVNKGTSNKVEQTAITPIEEFYSQYNSQLRDLLKKHNLNSPNWK